MNVHILLPAPLYPFAGGLREIPVNAETVGEALDRLIGLHPRLNQTIRTETGEIRPFVNVFVNKHDIRHLGRLESPLKEGDTIRILPSIAGG